MIDKAIFQLPGARRALAALVAFAFARAMLTVGQAATLSAAIVGLWGGGALADQALLIAGFFLCFLGRQGIAWAQDAYLERFASDQAKRIRAELLRALFSHAGALVQERGTGSVAALALEGVDQVEAYLRLIMPKVCGVAVVPAVLLAWIFPFDWVSGLIALVVFPFIILYMVMLGHTAKNEAARRHAQFLELSGHFVDSLRGMDTLAFFGRLEQRADAVFQASERFRDVTMKTLRIATLSSAVLDVFATLSLAAVAIMLGFRLVDGSMALFPALFVLVLTPEYFRPVREFAADYHASLDGKNALSGIMELVDASARIGIVAPGGHDADVSVRAGASTSAAEPGEGALEQASEQAPAGDAAPAPDKVAASGFVADASVRPWDESCTLELDNVGFAYPGEAAPALSDVAFSVRGCVRVGIVGASGSGKSTLVRLLAGFCAPSAGTVRINGVAPADLRDSAWQAQATYIPQDPYIFHATLRENMAFYRLDASRAEIERALDCLGLRDVADELPDGLDTLVGEGGRALSGGQAQRVALARALLDPARRVLLFDEPTAHLDIETEMELKGRMLPLMEGRLVFFATHRLHWMADMDYVAVVEDGRIVEFGTPDELRASNGAFCRLAARMRGGASSGEVPSDKMPGSGAACAPGDASRAGDGASAREDSFAYGDGFRPDCEGGDAR